MKEHTSYFAASWVWRMRKRQVFANRIKELIARLESIEESNRENSKNLIDTINDLKDTIEKQSTTVEHYRKEMELMRKQLEAKDEVNRMLANEIQFSTSTWKHGFGRTSGAKKAVEQP